MFKCNHIPTNIHTQCIAVALIAERNLNKNNNNNKFDHYLKVPINKSTNYH